MYAVLIVLFRDVDDVHDLMDDIQEQNEVATEISDALSQPIGFNQEIDDVSIGLSCDQKRIIVIHYTDK